MTDDELYKITHDQFHNFSVGFCEMVLRYWKMSPEKRRALEQVVEEKKALLDPARNRVSNSEVDKS